MIGWYLALGLACSLAVLFFYLWVASVDSLEEERAVSRNLEWICASQRDLIDNRTEERAELESLLADARIERDALRDELAKLKAHKVRVELGSVDRASDALDVVTGKLNQPKKRVRKAKVNQ